VWEVIATGPGLFGVHVIEKAVPDSLVLEAAFILKDRFLTVLFDQKFN
jgi:hypothetical protein